MKGIPMSTTIAAPVLIIGGSGIVGSQAAQTLRKLHPDLPIAIGGRDLAKAKSVADTVGSAEAVSIDLDRADLGEGEVGEARELAADAGRDAQQPEIRAGA